VVTEENLCYSVNPEQLAYYHVTYEQLYNRFKELAGSNQVHEIANGAQSVPVIIGQDSRDADLLLANTIANSDGVEVPLSYLVESFKSESFKRLSAGSEGEYYSIVIEQATDAQIKAIMEDCKVEDAREDVQLKSAFHGNYFDSRAMIRELAMVLLVAVLLLYFILAAQFESLLQPAIILTEIVIDVSIVLLVLLLMGESLNIMSMIGLVVMSGIIINDSILKVDTTNQLYRSGMPLLRAVLFAGQRRLKPIVMTSLTTILALLPFLNKGNMGAAMQYPLSLTLIVGMVVGTLVSLYFVPLVYYLVYKKLGKIA
jgi:multidrug efflux pump subunit AcrB